MSTAPCASLPLHTFENTQTFQHLYDAYLEEMCNHQLYLYAARWMEEASLYVIAHAFRFCAAQEKEHAAVFLGLIAANGGHPPLLLSDNSPLLPPSPMDILRTAAENEHHQWNERYPACSRIAQQEGYLRAADAFRRIAETELTHASRFRQFATALEEGSLFRDTRRISWFCLPCGQLHTGQEAPQRCSSCGKSQGHFIRSSFYPFVVER